MEMIYRITGLDCPSCTARMEKVIGKVKGVRSASINFVTGRTVVETERADAETAAAIEAAVRKAEPRATFEKM